MRKTWRYYYLKRIYSMPYNLLWLEFQKWCRKSRHVNRKGYKTKDPNINWKARQAGLLLADIRKRPYTGNINADKVIHGSNYRTYLMTFNRFR